MISSPLLAGERSGEGAFYRTPRSRSRSRRWTERQKAKNPTIVPALPAASISTTADTMNGAVRPLVVVRPAFVRVGCAVLASGLAVLAAGLPIPDGASALFRTC